MIFSDLTIDQIKSGLKSKDFSCRELVQFFIGEIHRLEPSLNAFITVTEKEALKEGDSVDREIGERGNSREIWEEKPLLGIPFAAKDLFLTKGLRTTAGSKVLDNYVPVYDATIIEKLKQAGAIIIGKTNCDAWAHGASGENSQYGSTHNPYDLKRTPGGSSSGSAVAVSAGVCTFSLGTDTGGSIRQPASFCNVVGIKPTYGRVSRYGVVAMASSLDSMGHFTKTVYDNALILNITAGKDSRDATTFVKDDNNFTEKISEGVKDLKIGIPKEYFQGLDLKIKEKILGEIKTLERLGADIIEVSLPNTKYSLPVYYIIQPAEVSSNLARYDGIRYGKGRDCFGDEAKRRIMIGTYTLSSGYYDAYYLKAMKVRTLIKKDFDDVFKKVDALISPVSPTLPFNLGEKIDDPLKMYLADVLTVTANLAGIPSLAIPAGFIDNLPVGMQIMGPNYSEGLLYKIGCAYEKETNCYKQRSLI